MKRLFALLMFWFMIAIVASVQAVPSQNDCSCSYNIDNINAPPGEVVFIIENCTNEARLFYEQINPMYAASRDAVINQELPISKQLNYYTCDNGTKSKQFNCRKPRDGL
jgi:hypothetical protein